MEAWFPRIFAEVGEEAASYAAAFLHHQITPEDCDGLNNDLLAELGVKKIGHRIRILRAIHENYEEMVGRTPKLSTHKEKEREREKTKHKEKGREREKTKHKKQPKKRKPKSNTKKRKKDKATVPSTPTKRRKVNTPSPQPEATSPSEPTPTLTPPRLLLPLSEHPLQLTTNIKVEKEDNGHGDDLLGFFAIRHQHVEDSFRCKEEERRQDRSRQHVRGSLLKRKCLLSR